MKSDEKTDEIGRREFVQLAGLAGAGLAVTRAGGLEPLLAFQQSAAAPGPDAAEKELVLRAIDAARSAGAAYADARITRLTTESISAREEQLTGVNRGESYGIGIRALVGGSWGFAATRDLTNDAVTRAAREAVAVGAANDKVNPVKTPLAPVKKIADGRWMTPHQIDPFTVSAEQKADLLFKTNESALRVKGVQFVNSSVSSVKESKLLATTDGSLIQQTFLRMFVNVEVTAVASDNSDSQTRNASVPPMGRGWEYVVGLDMPESASRWAEEAVLKLSAPKVEAGLWDLVLHPSHLWLTIHESIGHSTELDRARGYEANYAGTTFVAPPEKVLNKLRFGKEFMNVNGNRSEPGALATVGWDDEGVPGRSWRIIDKGLFVNYQTTRELVGWISNLTRDQESHGCAYAEGWWAIPFPRMPNVSLMPNPKDISEEEVIAETKHGIFIEGNGSYSIDQQRYNFQFGGQSFWEIRDGKRFRMLRDVAYQSRTLDFWNSMALVGGQKTYALGGTFSDGKGQPSQSSSVSHGCPVALFRNVNVLRTA
jgi:TldD protein